MWVVIELERDEILMYQVVKYCSVGGMYWLWRQESIVTGGEGFSASVIG